MRCCAASSPRGGCWPCRPLEPGRRYPEPEVNELLGRYHPDYAMLRRYLVDDGFLDRADETGPGTRSVKVYWRTGGSIDLSVPTSS
jgi:hypothetical protein